MRIRQACAYMLMAGGMLLFTGGAAQSEQSKSGTQSGGAMKQGHESSGKMGQDSSVITEDNPGGIITRGGRGDLPSSSKVDPLSTDQRDSNLGSKPNSGSSSGNKGSSGGMGSSSGTGSSGGASGGAGGR